MANPTNETIPAKFQPWGRGMSVAITQGAVFIRIPVTKETVANAGASKSGKNKLLATSGGLLHVPDAPAELRVNISATTALDAKV